MVAMRRKLGLIDVFCIATGAMISSGIFILPGVIFDSIGPAMFISYLLAGILSLVGIINVLELSTAMPCAGGNYYFITRSMGPLIGTVAGCMSWFALVLKTAFAIYGMAEVFHVALGWPIIGPGMVFTLIFLGVNLIGVKEAAMLENLMVWLLLAICAAFFCWGLGSVSVHRFSPFILPGKRPEDILFTAGVVYVAYGGLLQSLSISEEVKNPTRNIPLGIISSIFVVTVLYVLILIVAVGMMPPEKLRTSMTPLADAAALLAGKPGWIAMSIAAMLAFTTTANAGIMASARYPFSMSRDGFFPKILSWETAKGTPVPALLLTAAVMMTILFMPLEMLVKSASAVILSTYVLSAFAVIILRESKVLNYRPTFRAPFYPIMQIVTIILFSLLVYNMGWAAMRFNLGLILACVLIYYLYGRKTSREYALLHLLERITNRRLTSTSHGLEDELKHVVHERDEVIKDAFDLLVEQSPVLDLAEAHSEEEFLQAASAALAERTGLDLPQVRSLLEEREKESSTVINHFVAIPHIIMEGNEVFELIIVRCVKGIRLPGADETIKAAFVLAGTRDRRNLHLKALAAIAQIIQGPNFERRWLEARDRQQLRDILLLGKRKRNVPAGPPKT